MFGLALKSARALALNKCSVSVSGVSRFLPVANPPNRFEKAIREYDLEETPGAPLLVYEDHSRSILSRNDSPDVGFDFSVNPYRGCFHGCSYCYARPSHEYLSFGAGSDFERKIVVKPNAPELLREAFDKKSWKGDLVMFSGITDCYQPLEHERKLTRGCLEVCLEYKNPLGIITKSPIIERDIDLLVELVKHTSRCRVSISIPFWNAEYAKAMEPFVTTPARRMKIIETLAKAGVPVGISVSPIVPGLNDEDIGEVLERAAGAGASHAFFVLLRLPGAVKDVFEKSLREKLPLRAEKVFRRLREAHDGKLYDSAFGKRGRGDSVYAKTIESLFTRTAVKLGLKEPGMTSNSYEEMLNGAGPAPPTSFVRPNRSPQTSFGF